MSQVPPTASIEGAPAIDALVAVLSHKALSALVVGGHAMPGKFGLRGPHQGHPGGSGVMGGQAIQPMFDSVVVA